MDGIVNFVLAAELHGAMFRGFLLRGLDVFDESGYSSEIHSIGVVQLETVWEWRLEIIGGVSLDLIPWRCLHIATLRPSKI